MKETNVKNVPLLLFVDNNNSLICFHAFSIWLLQFYAIAILSGTGGCCDVSFTLLQN